jgi:hypothetical protein
MVGANGATRPANVATLICQQNGLWDSSLPSCQANSGCWLTLPAGFVCKKDPAVKDTFRDVWGEANKGAANDITSCYNRAGEYWQWCGLPDGQKVTANLRPQGIIRVWDPASNGCWITLGSGVVCAADTSLRETFRDYNGEVNRNAGNDAAVCLLRAREYWQWCKIADRVTVTATHRPSGRSVTFDPAKFGCWITLETGVTCKSDLSLKGVFEDISGETNKGTAENKQSCFNRASDYYTWCALTSGQTVVATFRMTGESFTFSAPPVVVVSSTGAF